jgi:hypothetical protein
VFFSASLSVCTKLTVTDPEAEPDAPPDALPLLSVSRSAPPPTPSLPPTTIVVTSWYWTGSRSLSSLTLTTNLQSAPADPLV